MTAAAGAQCPAVLDDELCTDGYPRLGPDFGLLCNSALEHTGNHRALAEIAGAYRRHVVWAQDGTVLPDEETSLADRAQGHDAPSEGVRLT